MKNLQSIKDALQSQLAINQKIITDLHEMVMYEKEDLKRMSLSIREEEKNPNPHNGRWLSQLVSDKEDCLKFLQKTDKKLKQWAKIQKALKDVVHGRVGCHNT